MTYSGDGNNYYFETPTDEIRFDVKSDNGVISLPYYYTFTHLYTSATDNQATKLKLSGSRGSGLSGVAHSP
jgi:hypothetical protein